jgi:hypothetical protein
MRLRLLAQGFWPNRLMESKATVEVWSSGGSLSGTLRLRFANPKSWDSAQRLRLAGPGLHRLVTLEPGQTRIVSLAIESRGPYRLTIASERALFIDGRSYSGLASPPVFVPSARAADQTMQSRSA